MRLQVEGDIPICELCEEATARWICLIDGGDRINDAGYAEATAYERMLCDDCRAEETVYQEELIEGIVL